MTTNWYSENSYFDRSGESELVVLPLTYDRSREWRFNRIGYVIYYLCYTGFYNITNPIFSKEMF